MQMVAYGASHLFVGCIPSCFFLLLRIRTYTIEVLFFEKPHDACENIVIAVSDSWAILFYVDKM